MSASFNAVPTADELQQIERDLQFYPSATANPAVLSPQQIQAFNRDGYLRGLRAFAAEEIETVRSYFDGLLARVLAAGGDSYSISTAHLKYGPVYDLLVHPQIVAVVRDLLGDDVIGWGSHFFCKLPHDGKQVAWHQDASYWPLTPSKTVTVWLAIDDADEDNACM
jgi:non-heme Fe2+,alpha-ketoglutarate-dependent halogenase